MKNEDILINGRAHLYSYILDRDDEMRVESRPAVVIFPGGAYLYCSSREAEPVALCFNSAGFDAYVLTYTTRHGFKEAYKDAVEAMKFIKEHQKENGINSLVVCGFSAGAHLACSISTMGPIKPDGMILVYPPVFPEDWAKAAEDVPSLLDKIDKTTPKAFLVHAYDDSIVSVKNTYELMRALDENGIEFESHVFRSGGHGFSIASSCVSGGLQGYENDVKALWVPLAINWIKNAISPIKFKKTDGIDENLVPVILKNTLGDLLSHKRVLDYLKEEKSPFVEPKLLSQLQNIPFHKVLIGMGMSLDDMKNFASKLETLL